MIGFFFLHKYKIQHTMKLSTIQSFYCLDISSEDNKTIYIFLQYLIIALLQGFGLGLRCLTPLSTIFQLYRGSQLY